MKHVPENTDTTLFKSFANYSDLNKKTYGYRIYVELSNGYFIPVTKKHLKMVSDSMGRNEDKFCGSITYMSAGSKIAQVGIK